MSKQSRLTVLLGAGAMMEVTSLSCSSITQKVISKQQKIFRNDKWESVPFLNFVYEHLKAYYYKESTNVNFEDVFHALEMWCSLKTAEDEQAVKAFRSVFGMFCDVKEDFAQIPTTLIYKGLQDLVDTVIEDVAAFESDVDRNVWFSNFFEVLQQKMPLDIFTLNYDTWLEQILRDYNDGFSPICDTHQRFSANKLFCSSDNRSTINHLHGQICFTTHLPTGSKRFLTDGWYKANDYDLIRKLNIHPKHIGYMAKTQAAEQIYQFPIITGLRKNDKIMMPPFDSYYMHLHQQLRSNANLLIVGYGFGDLYINSLLNQFRHFHGDDGKVICIGYLNPKAWVHNVADMPLSTSMKQSIYSMFGDPALPHRFLGFDYSDHIDSADGNSKLYLGGFKKTASMYADEILRFLTL